ncbi:MAG: FG-GAP repeat domain-containing protein, partial [bacterium]
MKKILLLTSFIALFSQSEAQISFSNYKDIVVNQGSSRTLKLPFSGGLDAPQFSECDLDMDGTLDLVVFDREGYRISTFINDGIANQISYTYAPEYEKLFPKIIDWMLMLDYDADGKNDIFSAAPGGVRVYKNVSNSTTGLRFELKENSLLCDYGSIITNLYVEQQDIPAILDVDDDGDIDILTFSKSIDTSGESIYWYKNLSIENFNRKDTFIYEVGKECWGRFRESYTDCRANLQYANGICGLGGKSLLTYNEEQIKNHFTQKSADGKHSGSTLLVFDANNDGKKDLLVGDISCNTMYLLFNNTNNLSPVMTSAIQHYPNQRPIDVYVFPAAFLVDVNNDGKKDLIVAPNTPNNSDNFENIHLYIRNDSTSGSN